MSNPIRIMPAGDSITASSDELRGGYRGPLQDLFHEFGVGHKFVGSRTDRSGDMVAPAHEGYPGWAMEHLLNGNSNDYGTLSCLADSVKTYEPDVMLLLCGTNPIYEGDPQVVGQSMRALVDNMIETRPQMHLVLGSILPIIPGLKPWGTDIQPCIFDRVKRYNIYQAALVNEYRNQGKLISFVDHYPIVNGPVDLGADGVHPAANVYPRMAWTWFAGMKAAGVI